jgi:hypothetical protein
MVDRAAQRAAPPSRSDNLSRNPPRLPGTSMPARRELPLAYIHQPAPSPTQSGRARKEWVVEFEPMDPPEIDPLTGWIGSQDPFPHIRLRFPDQQSAIEFAERQGWRYEVRDPPVRRFRPKSYADNFRYDLADAIARVQQRWDGSLSIAGRRQPDGSDPSGWADAIGEGGKAQGRLEVAR